MAVPLRFPIILMLSAIAFTVCAIPPLLCAKLSGEFKPIFLKIYATVLQNMVPYTSFAAKVLSSSVIGKYTYSMLSNIFQK
jgi:hypothetical protein